MTILLAGYGYGRVERNLRYDPASGRSDFVRGEPDVQTARGFYYTAGEALYGVHASPEGAVFFRGTERTPVGDPSFCAEVVQGPERNRFVLRRTR